MGAPPIRNGVAIGHFDMTLPRSCQGMRDQVKAGSVRLGGESFGFPGGMVRTSGTVGMFHTKSFRPHPPCHHPFETSRIHGGSHCSLKGKQAPLTAPPWSEGRGQHTEKLKILSKIKCRPWLLLCPGYCEECCNELWSTSVF